ncbi:MAG: hypothetical protein L6Q71_01180 [Planctomycetes bacterium]|nr:hypothetical protein [Planctomycetota bacterium]NUQ33666.1 hypothetical protein [Planctomycetaceae bacterium]
MAAKSKAKSARAEVVAANQAASMSQEEQWQELCNIAFGESWDDFKKEISQRLEGFKDEEPIVQSTNRALDMIKTMMFERL